MPGLHIGTAGGCTSSFYAVFNDSLSTGLSEKFLMVRRVDRFSKKIRDRSCISFDEYSGRGGRGICWNFSINSVY